MANLFGVLLVLLALVVFVVLLIGLIKPKWLLFSKEGTPLHRLYIVIGLILLPLMLFMLGGALLDPPAVETANQAEAVQPQAPVEAPAANASNTKDDSECIKNLECIGNKGAIAAGVYCPEYIEKLAKNSVKWTDGFLEPKFSHFRWKDKEAGIVTHLGDKVQFQNGFGAYVNMVYSCDLDMKQDRGVVVGVDAAEGRL